MVRFTKLKALSVILAAAVLIFGLPVSASASSSDLLLTLDGIEGSSTDEQYKGAIEVSSFSFESAYSAANNSRGGAAGKATYEDIEFSKWIDKSSLPILRALATGKHIPSGTLYVRKAGDRPFTYLKIQLSDIVITSYSISDDSDEHPKETFSIRAQKIELEYTEMNPDGSAEPPVKLEIDIGSNTVK